MIFFFNDTATTEIYTLSLHDALPISGELKTKPTQHSAQRLREIGISPDVLVCRADRPMSEDIRKKIALLDRKSTRLNSSHANISYAVFCLKKKKHERLHSRSTTN